MIYAARSSMGSVRGNNEDAYYMPRGEERLFIVADGMGGHQAGEVASRMAVDIISGRMLAALSDGISPGELLLRRCVMKANREIFEEAQRSMEHNGMGTTLTLVFINKGTAYIAHVGDSRIYLAREEKLLMLTSDHSLTAELVRRGVISQDAAARHPYRNMITRSLGTEMSVTIDTSSVRLKTGDRLLLCTDGLTNQMDDEELLDIILGNEPDASVSMLVDAVLARGGHDNITAIHVTIEEGDV